MLARTGRGWRALSGARRRVVQDSEWPNRGRRSGEARVPGAGLEPARPEGAPDFKSPLAISVYLGRSELFLLTPPIRPSLRGQTLGLSRPVSLPLCCHPATPQRAPAFHKRTENAQCS